MTSVWIDGYVTYMKINDSSFMSPTSMFCICVSLYLSWSTLCFCDQTLMKTKRRKEKVYFSLQAYSPSLREAKAATQVRHWSRGRRGHRGTPFTGLLSRACLACFISQPSTICRTLSQLPTSTLIRNVPTELPIGPYDRCDFSFEVLSSLMALLCMKFMKPN